jgi:hypothetical protein
MTGSSVVLSGFTGTDAFSSSYELTQRSSSGVTPSGPPVVLIEATSQDGVSRVRGRRPLDGWPTDGSRAIVWALGPVSGPADDPRIDYHGTMHAVGGSTATVVLSEAQNTCTQEL